MAIISATPSITNQRSSGTNSSQTTRIHESLESLNSVSSIFWRRVMAIYNMGAIHPRLAIVGVEILTNI